MFQRCVLAPDRDPEGPPPRASWRQRQSPLRRDGRPACPAGSGGVLSVPSEIPSSVGIRRGAGLRGDINFLIGIAISVTTLKSAKAHGPCFFTGAYTTKKLTAAPLQRRG